MVAHQRNAPEIEMFLKQRTLVRGGRDIAKFRKVITSALHALPGAEGVAIAEELATDYDLGSFAREVWGGIYLNLAISR